jgi:large subunit ribosomal protein L22
MTGPKLNEAPVRLSGHRRVRVNEETTSFRAKGRYLRVSPYKVREVLDLIRGLDAERARETLRLAERDAATIVDKVLASAMANGENHHEHPVAADELYVSACYADEGPTLKRWRPRARGRATRIRKRTCHITVIVSRLPDDELRDRRARQPGAADRRRRTAASRRPRKQAAAPTEEIVAHEDVPAADAAVEEQPIEAQPVEAQPVEAQPVEDVAPEPEAEPEAAKDKEQDK